MFLPFYLVVTVAGIVAAIIVADIQYKKQSKYENALMQKCIQEKGYDFVERIINIAKDCSLGKDFIIKSMEQALGIEHHKKGGKKHGMDILSCNTL